MRCASDVLVEHAWTFYNAYPVKTKAVVMKFHFSLYVKAKHRGTSRGFVTIKSNQRGLDSTRNALHWVHTYPRNQSKWTFSTYPQNAGVLVVLVVIVFHASGTMKWILKFCDVSNGLINTWLGFFLSSDKMKMTIMKAGLSSKTITLTSHITWQGLALSYLHLNMIWIIEQCCV